MDDQDRCQCRDRTCAGLFDKRDHSTDPRCHNQITPGLYVKRFRDDGSGMYDEILVCEGCAQAAAKMGEEVIRLEPREEE